MNWVTRVLKVWRRPCSLNFVVRTFITLESFTCFTLALSLLLKQPVTSCSQLDSARVTLRHHLSISLFIRLANQPSKLLLPNLISNLLRHSSVCTRSIVPVTTDLRPGCGHISHIGFPCVQPCSLHGPPVPPPPRPEGLVWVLASGLQHPRVHAAISPAAGFGFDGVPLNVVRNDKSQRSESGRLGTFHVLHSTWCHDQHLITQVWC